jgi:hypothetical protein
MLRFRLALALVLVAKGTLVLRLLKMSSASLRQFAT